MKISMVFFLLSLLFLISCESVNPAGTAQYENPSYPTEEKGYFFCGEDPFDCCFAPGTSVVWISEPAGSKLFYKDVSKAVVNPVISDTLYLDFSPGLVVAPEQGASIYVAQKSGNDIYRINTELLTSEKVYTSAASIYTMKLSSDGSILYLGSQGAPWMAEAVSTVSWQQTARQDVEWPVYRLEVSPNDSLVAIANSGRQQIVLLDGSSLAPLDTLEMPMRIGTMAFLENSRVITVLDASQGRPYMIQLDLISFEELFRSRPYNSYLINFRQPGSNTLFLPRNGDTRISVLNMENMTFAPSIPLLYKPGESCITADGEFIVTLSRTSSPGRATVFHYGD